MISLTYPLRRLAPFFVACALAAPLAAQNPPPGDNSGQSDNSDRHRNFDPSKIVDHLRDQLGVTDDAEWAVISPRIQAVFEIGLSTRTRISFSRHGDDSTHSHNTGNPEADALRSAISENMPDAEIKARLERFREVKKDNAAKLAKAQSDLEAVLTIKQEAILVMMGLLP